MAALPGPALLPTQTVTYTVAPLVVELISKPTNLTPSMMMARYSRCRILDLLSPSPVRFHCWQSAVLVYSVGVAEPLEPHFIFSSKNRLDADDFETTWVVP